MRGWIGRARAWARDLAAFPTPTAGEMLARMTPLPALPPRPRGCDEGFPWSLPCTVGILQENGNLLVDGPAYYRYDTGAWVRHGRASGVLEPFATFSPTHWMVL